MTESRAPTAGALLESLLERGATHFVGLPDNNTAALFSLLEHRDDVPLISVTREGEAFAVASGLWIGGGRPVVVVQNTGLLESGDSLRGTAARMGVPLLTLVSWRGFAKLAGLAEVVGGDGVGGGGSPAESGGADLPRELLVREDLDSAALLLEPTLRAWGIPFDRYASDADLARLSDLWDVAFAEERPVALLLTRALEDDAQASRVQRGGC